MVLHYTIHIIFFVLTMASIVHACPLYLAIDHQDKKPFFYDDQTNYFTEHKFDKGSV